MDIRTNRLNKAFKASGLSQSELCDKADINKGALSSYLSGRYFPKQIALEKLSSALNVSISYLMGFDTDDTTDKGVHALSHQTLWCQLVDKFLSWEQSVLVTVFTARRILRDIF